MAETEWATVDFTLKQHVSGRIWVNVEVLEGEISILKNATLGFDLPEKTTPEQAREIEDFLRTNIVGISYTRSIPNSYA